MVSSESWVKETFIKMELNDYLKPVGKSSLSIDNQSITDAEVDDSGIIAGFSACSTPSNLSHLSLNIPMEETSTHLDDDVGFDCRLATGVHQESVAMLHTHATKMDTDGYVQERVYTPSTKLDRHVGNEKTSYMKHKNDTSGSETAFTDFVFMDGSIATPEHIDFEIESEKCSRNSSVMDTVKAEQEPVVVFDFGVSPFNSEGSQDDYHAPTLSQEATPDLVANGEITTKNAISFDFASSDLELNGHSSERHHSPNFTLDANRHRATTVSNDLKLHPMTHEDREKTACGYVVNYNSYHQHFDCTKESIFEFCSSETFDKSDLYKFGSPL